MTTKIKTDWLFEDLKGYEIQAVKDDHVVKLDPYEFYQAIKDMIINDVRVSSPELLNHGRLVDVSKYK